VGLEKLEDDFFVTEENAGELLKKFSINILTALEIYVDYHKSIQGSCPSDIDKYVFCVVLELLSR